MSTATQSKTLLESLINTEDTSLEMLESLLMTLHEKKLHEVQAKESDSITTMQDIRARLDRLTAIFGDINFTLLWKDRVCKTLGRTAEGLRWELYKQRIETMMRFLKLAITHILENSAMKKSKYFEKKKYAKSALLLKLPLQERESRQKKNLLNLQRITVGSTKTGSGLGGL